MVVAVREWATEMIVADESTEPQSDLSADAEPPAADQ
jgi:hypothetical protein